MFTAVSAALGGLLVELRRTTGGIPGASEASFVEHQEIFRALERHDAPAARRATERHIRNTQARYQGARAAAMDGATHRQVFWDVIKKGPRETIAMMRMAQMLEAHTVTLTTGDVKTGMTASGQSVGLIHDIPTVAELMERLVAEAYAAQASLAASFDPGAAMPAAGAVSRGVR